MVGEELRYKLIRLGKLNLIEESTVWMEHFGLEDHFGRHVWKVVGEC